MLLQFRALLLVVCVSICACACAGAGTLADDKKDTKDTKDTRTEDREAAPKPLDAGQLEQMWKDLADGDAAKAYVAICTLAERPSQAVTLLRQHLRAVPAPDAKKIGRLIRDLDSGRFSDREKAMKELRQLGPLAGPALREALKGKPTLEARKRLDELLRGLEGPVTDPEILRAVRSAEVLERVATKEARDLLRDLGKGATGARLTQECQDSLRRLEQRP
jgi:hypothetical protein